MLPVTTRNLDDSTPTRLTLLARLKDRQDQQSWQAFFDTYWRLLYGVARQAGLTDAEAQDVVQETLLAVAQRVDGFRPDPALGSFKHWLLQITRRRIADQFRKRSPTGPPSSAAADDSTRTATIERVADPASLVQDDLWEQRWQRNLTDLAMERVKHRVRPKHWLIFQQLVLEERRPRDVAVQCGASLTAVYVAKHRVAAQIKKEARRLQKQMR